MTFEGEERLKQIANQIADEMDTQAKTLPRGKGLRGGLNEMKRKGLEEGARLVRDCDDEALDFYLRQMKGNAWAMRLFPTPEERTIGRQRMAIASEGLQLLRKRRT